MVDLEKLTALARAATPGPWQVQDGCSWRRIGSRTDRGFEDGNVLCPTKSPTDGHPDLTAGRDDDLYANLRYIAACSPDAILALIERVRGLERTFDLMWDADMRAIKDWQRETGEDMVWPDRAELTGWLIERATRAEARCAELEGLLGAVRKWMDIDNFGPWEAKFCARIDAALNKEPG